METALTIFYLAAALAVVLIGAGVLYASMQIANTLKSVRQQILPQVELTLTEVQNNLTQIDTLTRDVDTTVEEATQLVHSANKTVQSVEAGIDSFNKKIAAPALVRMASAMEGVRAGMRHMRERRTKEILVIEEPGGTALIEEREIVESHPKL